MYTSITLWLILLCYAAQRPHHTVSTLSRSSCVSRSCLLWCSSLARHPHCFLAGGYSTIMALEERKGARVWATRTSNELDAALVKVPRNFEEVEIAHEAFLKRLQILDDIQTECEREIKTELLEADIIAAADYRKKICLNLPTARRYLTEKEPSVTSPTVAKLPKIELPSFSGNALEWTSFWEAFQVTIDQGDLAEVQKFTYLRSLLSGDALHAIQGLSLTSANYLGALKILKERFGRSEKIVFSHITALLNISCPSFTHLNMSVAVSVLWELYDTLQTHIRSLEAHSISSKECGAFLVPLILSRVPDELRLEWARHGEGHENDLNFLMEFLKLEIARRERSDTFAERAKTPSATILGIQTDSSKMCGVCNKTNHSIFQCNKFRRSSSSVNMGSSGLKLKSAIN